MLIREADGDRLSGALEEIAARAEARLESGGSRVEVSRTYADLRYVGQSHEITVPIGPAEPWGQLASLFHDEHESRNGFARRSDPIEVVTVRAEAEGLPAFSLDDLPEWIGRGEPDRGHRTVVGADGPVDASVWWRDGLDVGAEVVGPAVVEEAEATTFIGNDERAVVLDSGALELEW
jgi:N-methylhydantoinase A